MKQSSIIYDTKASLNRLKSKSIWRDSSRIFLLWHLKWEMGDFSLKWDNFITIELLWLIFHSFPMTTAMYVVCDKSIGWAVNSWSLCFGLKMSEAKLNFWFLFYICVHVRKQVWVVKMFLWGQSCSGRMKSRWTEPKNHSSTSCFSFVLAKWCWTETEWNDERGR